MAGFCLAASACTSPPSRHQATGSGGTARAAEDAGPRYFAEDEVDRPARPLAPIEPTYPPALRAMGTEGDVEARVVVLADGSVGGARFVASSHALFTAAVRDSLRSARFHPAELAGQHVASWVTVRHHFRLQ